MRKGMGPWFCTVYEVFTRVSQSFCPDFINSGNDPATF